MSPPATAKTTVSQGTDDESSNISFGRADDNPKVVGALSSSHFSSAPLEATLASPFSRGLEII